MITLRKLGPSHDFGLLKFLKAVDADGLIECLQVSLKSQLGIDVTSSDDVLRGESVLVGVSTDGATVNIGHVNGTKTKLQAQLPWLTWQWCYAHRLELACKDALCSQLIKDIKECLLCLYYLYRKSPKKSRELGSIVAELGEVYCFPKGGNMPVRSQGTRWIAHKRKALQRFVDRYGAYVGHLSAMVQGRDTKSVDKARVKGYLMKMVNSRVLIGAAMYIDLLKPAYLLSISLQEDKVNIVHGLQNILRASKSLQKQAEADPKNWPTVKILMDRIEKESTGGTALYQGAQLHNFNDDTVW